MERLQKYIAMCGVSSRRKAEQLILDGKVTVNGIVCTELGTKVTHSDIVAIEGKVIEPIEKVYYLMNKPRGAVSTVSDEKGRKTVLSILPELIKAQRVFPVGRLDYDTKGVLLLTNDGEFMNILVGPQSNIEKEYLARVDGIITKKALTRLANGLKIDDYITRHCVAYVKSIDAKNNSSLVGLIIKEGKNHQVKKMLEAVGYPVKHLTRVRFGNLTCEGVKEGEIRKLSIHEIKTLVALSRN